MQTPNGAQKPKLSCRPKSLSKKNRLRENVTLTGNFPHYSHEVPILEITEAQPAVFQNATVEA
jgi:hypothetical protein